LKLEIFILPPFLGDFAIASLIYCKNANLVASLKAFIKE